MKTSKLFRVTWSLLLLLCLNLSVSAQNLYQLAGTPELKVVGGSTLHDWEMVASTATGKAELILDKQSIQSVRMGEVSMKATALKSGKGQMDDIAYKSLKADKNPNIHFKLTSYKSLGGNKAALTGELTVAGTTRPVTFQVQSFVRGESVELKGEANCNMTDFNIQPPTAVFGTIKTDNKVKIAFKGNFNLIIL